MLSLWNVIKNVNGLLLVVKGPSEDRPNTSWLTKTATRCRAHRMRLCYGHKESEETLVKQNIIL